MIFGGVSTDELNAKVTGNAWIVGLVCVLLIVMVYMHHVQLNNLDKTLGLRDGLALAPTEPFDSVVPTSYVARLPQGRSDVGGANPPTPMWGQLSSSSTGGESFLGGHESPVFYDIGDVNLTRGARAVSATEAAERQLAAAAEASAAASMMVPSGLNSQASIDAVKVRAAANLARSLAAVGKLNLTPEQRAAATAAARARYGTEGMTYTREPMVDITKELY